MRGRLLCRWGGATFEPCQSPAVFYFDVEGKQNIALCRQHSGPDCGWDPRRLVAICGHVDCTEILGMAEDCMATHPGAGR